jgi:hypothetical protein
MSDVIPKWAYVLIGSLIVVLIIVSIVGLVTSGGIFSKILSITVIGVSVVVLFFGHKKYKRDHTLVGQATGFFQKAFRSVGLTQGGRKK